MTNAISGAEFAQVVVNSASAIEGKGTYGVRGTAPNLPCDHLHQRLGELTLRVGRKAEAQPGLEQLCMSDCGGDLQLIGSEPQPNETTGIRQHRFRKPGQEAGITDVLCTAFHDTLTGKELDWELRSEPGYTVGKCMYLSQVLLLRS